VVAAVLQFYCGMKRRDVTLAFSSGIGTERMADRVPGNRTYWTGAALFTKWRMQGPWRLAVRPEVYWDQDGRTTGFEQL
jgi:hypothetical protein